MGGDLILAKDIMGMGIRDKLLGKNRMGYKTNYFSGRRLKKVIRLEPTPLKTLRWSYP